MQLLMFTLLLQQIGWRNTADRYVTVACRVCCCGGPNGGDFTNMEHQGWQVHYRAYILIWSGVGFYV